MSTNWRTDGVRVVRAGELSSDTAQTTGMKRSEAISAATVGASKYGQEPYLFHLTRRLARITMGK